MKTKLIYLAFAALLLAACQNKNVYSDLLKAERKIIDNYISANNIKVVDSIEMPTNWEDNLFWKVPDYDNYYFHLVTPGDTTQAEVEKQETILLRFKRYTLDAYADTLYNWTTQDSPNPIKFQYLINNEYSCTGWQIAVKYMKYPDAQCKIICPSKMGFSEENSTVTPYGYDLKIKIKRY